ncbi:MAG: YfhO family protein [Saccharofermentans sp.]|nr:YfhO family protein [Saccharofermentans sp.]
MDKIRRKFSFADGFVLSLLIGVVTATVVFNILMDKQTGGAIFDGIASCATDVAEIRGGAVFADRWSIISAQGFDPFFLLALLLPGFAQNITLAGFFLKFGIAAGIMYVFLNKHTGAAPAFALVLSEVYAFSSQVIFTAQFNAVMNLTILMPLFMCVVDTYLRRRTYTDFIKLSIVTALMGLCYLPGLFAGLPFAIIMTLVMCIALYSGFAKCMKSFASALMPILLGLVIPSFTWIPLLGTYEITFTFEEAYDNAAMNFKLYDILSNMFAFSSGSMSNINPPVFYIGLITIVLIAIFLMNGKIPFRLKVSVLIISVLTYATMASSFMRWFSLPYGQNPIISASRLIAFTALLMFACGISARNMRDIQTGVIYAAGLIPCAFVVLTGNPGSDITRNTLVLIGTIAGFIAWMLFIKTCAAGRANKAFLIAFLVAAILVIGFNTYKIASLNTISHDFTMDPYNEPEESESMGVFYDEDGDTDLSVFTDSNEVRYLILSSDMSQMQGTYLDKINAAARAALAENVFDIEELRLASASNLTCPGVGYYSILPGFNSATFNCDIEDGGEYYLCSSFHCPISIEQASKTFELQDVYDGPFLHKVDNVAASYGITMYFNANEEETASIALGRLDPDGRDLLNSITRSAETGEISFRFDDIPGRAGGIKMVVTNIPYEPALTVKVNGRTCDTVSYAGLLAFTFSASSDRDTYNIDIDKSVAGLGAGIFISVTGIVLLLAIGVINKYNVNIEDNKNSEEECDAQQEDN